VFRKAWAVGLGMMVLAVLIMAGCGSDGKSSDPTATPLPGTLLDPPKTVTDFTLTSDANQPFHLSDLRGKVAVLFFGYTHCPDVCPTTLADFKRVKADLGDDADQVAFVFISVDGARDTPARLSDYVHAFDPDFIGLMGDDATIRAISQDYGVFFQRVNYDNSDNYLVDHTATSFVVGPEGKLRAVFSYQSDPAGMAQRIQSLLKK
jgi:protein SCO1